MSSILKVDTLQDVNGNAIISSDGSGNISIPNLTTTGNINLGDSDKIVFGAGSDFEILHNSVTGNLLNLTSSPLEMHQAGTNSVLQLINDGATHNQVLQIFKGATLHGSISTDTGKLKIDGIGSLELSDDGSTKLATTSTGINVTGSGTFSGSGSLTNDDTAIGLDVSGTNHIKQRITTPTAGGYQASLELESNSVPISIATTGSNDIRFISNSFEKMKILPNEVVMNEQSYDQDFRVESNNNTHALFVDGGSDAVLFGSSTVDPVSANVAGASIKAQGNIQASRASGVVISANRQTDDGDIFELRKNGITVGSIGVQDADNIYIASSASNHSGLKFSTNAVTALRNTANSDNSVDLGTSSVRFNDIFFGGQLRNVANTGLTIDTSGNATFNDNSLDADFRVESNNFANMLFVDGGTDRIGIGTNSPTTTLDVSKDSTSNIRVGGAGGGSVDTRLYVDNVGNGGSGRGVGIALRPSGSSNSVEAVKLIAYQNTASATANNASFAINVADTSGTLQERVLIDNSGILRVNPDNLSSGGIVNHSRAPISVSTTATNISNPSTYGGLAMVWVNEAGKIAHDLVSYSLSGVDVIASQNISSTPAARTYSAASGILKLAMASGTYDVRVADIRVGTA